MLATRVALFLLTYCTLLYITLVWPNTYQAINILIAIAEACSFYSFFALMVENLGGPASFVNILKKLNKTPYCCLCCCPNDPKGRYNRVLGSLGHMFWTRVVFVIIATVFAYLSGEII